MGASVAVRRLAVRGAAAAVTAVALAAGVQCAVPGAQASVARPRPVVNPYSPAYHHPYRRGVVPTIHRQKLMRQWARSHPSAGPTSANDLNYGGGIDGIGVTTGPEKVYLVFYGSQWGSQSTNGNGDVTLSGDPSGEAPYLQELMKGLGTGGELWSGVMTQYCDGVAVGAQSCPASNTEHVGYPAGGALAGVWVDESAPSPQTASGHQLGLEAVAAAAHFGNTTAASNRDAQYVIASPTGTNPDNWLTNGFCAWHDYNGDSTLSGGPVSSPYGDIAFTNLPYQTDAGFSCGQDFVNPNGTLDGVSIVEGHEYAETITDQNPVGGWTDFSGNETADKCAWIAPGTAGGAFDLSTGHGTFAMQTTWANDGASGAGTCEASHPIVTNPSDVVTVTNPGDQAGTVGTAVSLQIQASDSASGQTLSYSATGLPAGLSIDSSTGLISGTPTTAGAFSVKVTATDTTGASGSASFNWAIGKVASATSVSTSGTPSTYGQSVTFTATVTSTDGGGTVAFDADGTTITGCGAQSLTASGGAYTAACSTAALAAGSHTISATYSGDSNVLGSSGTLNGGQDVGQAPTTTSVSTSGSPSVFGQSVTFTATVTSTDGGGSVAFFADGPLITGCGNQSLTPAGGGAYAATCTTSALPAGSHAISAAYSGDSNVLGSSGALSGGQQVEQAPTTTFVSTSGPSIYGQPVTFTATVTSGDGGGTVAFHADGMVITGCGTQPLTASGGAYTATCTTTALSVGIHAVSATYTGDTNTNASSGSLSGGQVVNPAPLTADVVGSQTYGGSPSFTVTGYQGLVNGDNPSVVNGSLTGCMTTAGPGAGVGVHTGTISGCTGLSSPNYTITYGDAGLTVFPAPLTIEVAGSQTYGGSPSFTVTGYQGLVNGDPSSVVTGTLTGCTTTLGHGASVGTYPGTISACSGLSSPNYTLTYADAGFTVTPAQLLIIASNGTMTYGSAPPAIDPIYSGFVNGDGPGSLHPAPTCSTTATSASDVGTYPATCSGAADPNYGISYFPGTVTVNPASQTIAFTAPATGAAGGSAILTATGGGSGKPVTFTVDSTSGAGVCSVSGTNGSTVTYNAAGNCVIDANQVGNQDYLPAPPVTGTITVTKAAPTLTTEAGGTVVVAGAPLTDTATLVGGASPTGTITFTLSSANNTVVYTDHVTVSGNGTYSTAAGDKAGGFTPSTVGTYTWAVSYSGDNNNTGATAASETQAAVYGFGGFTAPLPKSTLQKSGSTIPVKFTLTNAAGQPISAAAAAALAAAGHVQATLSGPKITTVIAVCTWNSTGLTFQCNIKTPSGLVTGAQYLITAQENVTGTFMNAPAVSTSTTPNPETVFFK